MIKSLPLGDVAKFVRGITFKPDDVCENFTKDSTVCMRTKNVQATIDTEDLISVPSSFVRRAEQKVQFGDLLVSSANSWNLVGKACWVPELSYETTAGGFISILRCNRNTVEPRYFYHWVTSGRTQHELRYCGRQTTNISNLDFDRALALPIPLPHRNGKPDLDEQKRIAAILDKADGIRRKRQQALRLTDDFLRSVFLDMFGDPVTNPMGWRTRQFSESLENIDSGWSPKCHTTPAEPDEWGVLKLGAITWCSYNEVENKALPSDLLPRPQNEVQAGDLLFCRKNTHDLVAAAAYVFETRPKLMIPDLIFRLRLQSDSDLHPIFLWYLLNQPHQKKVIQSLAGGAAGSMPNISKAKLNLVSLIRPRYDQQEKFASLVEQCRKIQIRNTDLQQESNELFSSLQQRAFRGEL